MHAINLPARDRSVLIFEFPDLSVVIGRAAIDTKYEIEI
jgi:hypothetical protein